MGAGGSDGKIPSNGWFIRDNPIKMDYLGVSTFQETFKWIYQYIMTTTIESGINNENAPTVLS